MSREASQTWLTWRNRIIILFLFVFFLILFGLALFFLSGGNFQILADRAQYMSKQPVKAGNNLIKHGQVKGKSGRICGIVRGEAGGILTGARVSIKGEDLKWSTQVDEKGQYCIPPVDMEAVQILSDVLVGNYKLTAEKEGYYSRVKKASLESGEEKTVNFTLSGRAGEFLPDVIK